MSDDHRRLEESNSEWSRDPGSKPLEGSWRAAKSDSHVTLPHSDVGAIAKALRDLVDRTSGTAPSREPPSYLNLAAAAEDFIFVINLEGSIEYLNPAACAFLQAVPEHLVGQPFEKLDLLPSPAEAEELLAGVVTREEVVRYERAVPGASGTRYLYTTLSPIQDNEGTITGILGIAKDVSELARARDELRSLSMVDELTDVYNRRGFMSLASHHLSLAQRNGSRLCLIMADLDNLKLINDRFGHQRGDEALVALATILKGNCRKSDVVARVGGDEFALLASGVVEGSSEFLVARLRQAVRIEDLEGGKPYRFSASIGCVECLPGSSYSIERLLSEADGRMYEAKRARAS